MNKEDIKKIQEAIKQATAPRLVEARRLEMEEQKKALEIANQKRLNETRLRSTGVVDLFVQLRDSNTLTLYDNASSTVYRGSVGGFYEDGPNAIPLPFKDGKNLSYTPAMVFFSPHDYSSISISFDRHISGYSSSGQEDGPQSSDRTISAKISSQGQLTINEKVVNNNLVEVVKQSILEQKGLV